MKINVEHTLVEFTPENDTEKKQLGELWDLLLDCVSKNRHLEPVGEFVPADPEKSKLARFNIEE